MPNFRVSQDETGLRADVFLAAQYPKFTRSSLQGLFDRQSVIMKEKPLKPGHKLKADDLLYVDDALLKIEPPDIELPVLYEDENVIAINKPAGILTHSKGALNLEATVASFIKPRLNSDLGNGNRAGIVHRLDRPTSGVIICAKNKASSSFLQKQFSLRKVKKTYSAIVEGTPDPAAAVIEVPLARDPKRPQTFKASSDGKPAVSSYQTIKTFIAKNIPLSLVEVQPKTGRTHQIRVHMAYIGHPIFGDKIYGRLKAEHMYLHSGSLEITIPGGERKIFTAPEPNYFKELI